MKKFTSILLLLALLLTFMVPAALAAGTASVSVSSVNAKPGNEVNVSFSLSGLEEGFVSGKLTISYDSSVLTLTDLSGVAFNGQVNLSNGQINHASSAPVTAGTLAVATFKVADDAASGSYSVSGSVSSMTDVDFNRINVSDGSGTITVTVPHVCDPEFVEEDPASCTKIGTKAHYACECGKLYSDAEGKNEVTASDLEIPMLDHDYRWIVDKVATEDETGLKHEECSVCHDKKNEGTEIPKLDHEHVLTKVEAVAPTCGKPGNVEYYVCSDDDCADICFDAEGNVINDVVLPATGEHTYESGVCTECGAAKPSDPVTPAPTPDDDKEEEKKPTFIDVLPGAYYYDAVEWAVAEGITNGITATTFCPDMVCTRAQMVTFLWRAAGKPVPKTTEMPFKDVAFGVYYYDAVLWAVEEGITNGTSATTFSPDATVTRAQTVTFLWRMQNSPEADGKMVFSDVKQDAYYTDAVLWAVEEGITNGTSATTFSPDAGCTRAQIVTFLYRYFNK